MGGEVMVVEEVVMRAICSGDGGTVPSTHKFTLAR